MMRPRAARRGRWGVCLAAVAALALSTLSARPALGHDEAPGILPEGDWTEEQAHFAIDLVERTEAALPAFEDTERLTELGFFDFGATAPGGLDHWINPGWFDDEHILDPEHPEALVFRHTDDGGFRLEAAMFYLTTEHDMSNIPDDIGWLPGWHTHQELCVDEQGRYTGLVSSDGTCAVGAPADMPPMMHVWIVDNACGHRFAGVGVGGIDCEDGHGHGGPDPHEPDPHEPDPHEPDPHEPDPHEPDPQDPDDHGGEPLDATGDGSRPGRRPAGLTVPSARPAQPVRALPTYTG